MSIYATSLMIADTRQRAAELAAAGINFGVIDEDGEVEDLNDLPDEELDAPIIYEHSNWLPSNDDPRGGSVDTGWIPSHIEREGHPEGADGVNKDYLRLGVTDPGSQTREGGRATVILNRRHVERLRDDLTAWLEREPEPPYEG